MEAKEIIKIFVKWGIDLTLTDKIKLANEILSLTKPPNLAELRKEFEEEFCKYTLSNDAEIPYATPRKIWNWLESRLNIPRQINEVDVEQLIKKHYPNYDLTYKYRDSVTITISTVKEIIKEIAIPVDIQLRKYDISNIVEQIDLFADEFNLPKNATTANFILTHCLLFLNKEHKIRIAELFKTYNRGDKEIKEPGKCGGIIEIKEEGE